MIKEYMKKYSWILSFLLLLPAAVVTAAPAGEGHILLQTDRRIYIAGEDLFYKLFWLKEEGETTDAHGQIIYLVLRNVHNTTITHAMVRISDHRAWGSIYLPDTLATGMYQLLAYTNVMRNYGVEHFAAREIFVANRFDESLKALGQYGRTKGDTAFPRRGTPGTGKVSSAESLSVGTDKKRYGPREKIALEVKYDPAGEDTVVRLSVSVAEEHAFFPGDGYPSGEHAGSAMSLPVKKGEQRYLPENKGYILRGKVYADDRQPAPGVYVLLSVPDTVINLDYAVTDSTGMFRLLLNDHYMGKKIILMPEGPSRQTRYTIVPDDKYRPGQPWNPQPVVFQAGMREYLLKSQKIVGIQKVYHSRFVLPARRSATADGSRPMVYSHPDFTVRLSEYVPLRDLSEIAKEIIPYLKIRKYDDTYVARVYDQQSRVFFPESASVFLDGVPVKDLSQLIPLGSNDLKRIEIKERLWFCDAVRFNGIVAIFSGNDAIRKYRFPPDVLTLQMEAPAVPAGMVMPRYDDPQEKESRIPDFRQLLCWQPDLVMKRGETESLSFFSSDLPGVYVVRVTGVTGKGSVIMATSRFTVGNAKEKIITENRGEK